MNAPKPAYYVAAEPASATVYVDMRGQMHRDRNAAIEANFALDFDDAVQRVASQFGETPRDQGVNIVSIVRSFIKNHPDMVRVLLGDRDAT